MSSTGTSLVAQWMVIPLANAGVMGLIPGLGRFHMSGSNWVYEPKLLSAGSGAHELQPLSLCATTTEAQNLCSATREATAMRSPCTTMKSCPHWPQLEKAWPSAAKNKWKWKLLSCGQLFATPWTICPWNSPGQNTGVGSLSLLQEIFPIQGLNPGRPHCRQILYHLSYEGSPRMGLLTH